MKEDARKFLPAITLACGMAAPAPRHRMVGRKQPGGTMKVSIFKPLFSIMLACGVIACDMAAFQFSDTSDGISAYESRDYITALKEFQPLAKRGNAEAQYYLGKMYELGLGVPKDDAKSVMWYQKAAEQGNADAQMSLGATYSLGTFFPRDEIKAFEWYHKAAEQGNAKAQYIIGVKHEIGEGTPENYSEAARWYLRAAEQGHVDAQANLGEMYHSGQGVSVDYAEAVKWLQEAAEQGNGSAQFALAYMYHKGQGVSRDQIKAYMWLFLAKNQPMQKFKDLIRTARDQPTTTKILEQLESEMTLVQITEARRHAAERGLREAEALYNLGLVYFDGVKIAKDNIEAYKWLSLADTLEHEGALKALNKVKSEMTPAQITEGQRLATEWWETHSQ